MGRHNMQRAWMTAVSQETKHEFGAEVHRCTSQGRPPPAQLHEAYQPFVWEASSQMLERCKAWKRAAMKARE